MLASGYQMDSAAVLWTHLRDLDAWSAWRDGVFRGLTFYSQEAAPEAPALTIISLDPVPPPPCPLHPSSNPEH